MGTIEPPDGAQTLVLRDCPSPDLLRCLSPNGRGHWAIRDRARKVAATHVDTAAKRQRLSRVAGSVRITLRYVFPERRAHDLDNLVAAGKSFVDALVRGGWLTGDDNRTVRDIRAEAVYEKGARRLEIVLEPVREV